ncbi:MAG: alpha/beta fold hydrolase [Chloroflexia bacterium]|nr:alpha/beta fold hydrolase [Chloroflexia bacterium]
MPVTERGNPAAFVFRRGPIGCLLLHGYPASPAEMRGLGVYLAERGVSIQAPLLPGFGTVPEDLLGVRWQDWVAAAEAGLHHLRRHCHAVFCCGLSMGGAIALYLAAHAPVAGVAALAPAIRLRDRRFEWLPLISLFYPWLEPSHAPDDLADPQGRALGWHYRRSPSRAAAQLSKLVRATRHSLRRIQVPTLIVQSPCDSQMDPEGARWAYEQIPAGDKTLLWLERSGHNVLLDLERERIFEQVYTLISRVPQAPR